MMPVTVAHALTDHRWTRHFRYELEPNALMQAMSLWEGLQQIQLRTEIKDTITWRWSACSSYTASSAYMIQFQGALTTNYKAVI